MKNLDLDQEFTEPRDKVKSTSNLLLMELYPVEAVYGEMVPVESKSFVVV